MRTRGFSASGAPAHLTLAIALALALAAACGDKTPKYPSCSSDKDCRRSEHCVNRQCRQCASDDHCKKGATCIDGTCILAPGACGTDADCKDGKVCHEDRCIACSDDDQCGPDRRCRSVAGLCKRPGRGKPPEVACQLEPIYFGFDEAGLSQKSREALTQAAECIQSAPGRGVFLNGHTDPRGTEEYNIALSERRAETVADYLARLGIDPDRFKVVPRGETQSSGNDESSWSQDRRVDIEWQ